MAKKKEDISPELRRKLESMVTDDDDSEINVVTSEFLDRLKAVGNEFLRHHHFKVGDVVEWKPGCKNKRMPKIGVPVIVVEVLDKPVFDEEEKNGGSTYFREPLDIVCGMLDSDGDFILFHFDSRRFQPYRGE